MPKLYFGNNRYADLPLHYGRVPDWLAQRMSRLGGAIAETIISEFGRNAFLERMSDPLWFQSFGCVLGMDWHSSGITTSVMGALKRALNPISHHTGVFIAGGRGRHSRATPGELLRYASHTGVNGEELVRSSRLTAKVDNTAIHDGFQVYLHSFIATSDGSWTVVQQGMNTESGMARRYHWNSFDVRSYVEEPHSFIYGVNQGEILNMVHAGSGNARDATLKIAAEDPGRMLPEIRKIVMPSHHDVRRADVNMKRLGAVLTLAHETGVRDFESLLLLEGLGPRTIQSLALVSEVIYGAPSRFEDPARFSFAHGGKDGHPFPVPVRVYDETIEELRKSLDKARLDHSDRAEAIKNLSVISQAIEQAFTPDPRSFETAMERERKMSHVYGGRTVKGNVLPPGQQLRMFE